MSSSKPGAAVGTDWTKLLADPDLARNLGKLLQAYREAAPERREETLLAAMREIKQGASGKTSSVVAWKEEPSPQPVPTAASATPPFEPDIFSPNPGQDRRSHPRIRCFVAVELHVNESGPPVWGNLSNTSLGGCQVETAAHIPTGAKVEIGLWVATGKIWVKGIALNGVVTGNPQAGGVRVRFEGVDQSGKANLRQFLRYVQETTRVAKSERSYLQLLK